jgi:hypothetical protein
MRRAAIRACSRLHPPAPVDCSQDGGGSGSRPTTAAVRSVQEQPLSSAKTGTARERSQAMPLVSVFSAA